MKFSDVLELLVLAMLWGASFLFMRVAVPEFGPIALIEIRVIIGAIFLIPILLWKKASSEVLTNFKPIFVVAMLNTAIPFCLFAYVALVFTAGFTSVINATAPLWTALVTIVWLKEKPTNLMSIGLVIGFVGVVTMAWPKLTVEDNNFIFALAAGLLASFFYGVAAIYSKKHLQAINPLSIATGSLICASFVLMPLSYVYWPTGEISNKAWLAVLVMGIASTAIAYILYFRLVRHVGPSKAITVTYLIPVFGMVFGAIFLNEKIGEEILMGCGLILLGTSLATGLVKKRN